MDDERYLHLDRSGQGLTEEEYNEGYHWCAEWDYMLVGPGSDEALVCSCNHPKIEEWKRSEEGQRMQSELNERLDGGGGTSNMTNEELVQWLRDFAAANEYSFECELVQNLNHAADEIERLRAQIKELKNGFEGCCPACEPVGEMNKKLREERDEARREVCAIDAETYGSVRIVAERRGWDCFREEA